MIRATGGWEVRQYQLVEVSGGQAGQEHTQVTAQVFMERHSTGTGREG